MTLRLRRFFGGSASLPSRASASLERPLLNASTPAREAEVVLSSKSQWKGPFLIKNVDAETLQLCSWEDFVSRVLSRCNSKAMKEGLCVHSPMIKLGLQNGLFLNNNLLSLYSKCLGVHEAQSLFDEMPHRDVVSWTALICAYVREECEEEALRVFYQMLAWGDAPNEFTFSSVVRSCCSLDEFEAGVAVHAQIIKRGCGSNPVLASGLVDFYSKCGKLAEACKLFNSVSNHDTVSCTTMISSFSRAGDCGGALRLYNRMIGEGIPPNEYTFVELLSASGVLDLNYGKLLHAHSILWGIQLNLVVKTALLNMYSKYHMMENSVKVMKLTPENDVMLWTALISGYTEVADCEGAVLAFSKMEQSGVSPNEFSFSGILNVCSSVLSIELGQQIHSRVIKAGLDCNVSVGNALVDMYMKCSSRVEESVRVFEGIDSPNVISWTSLLAGYARRGLIQEALEVLASMRVAGIHPNSFTISALLKCCRTMEGLIQVRKIHAFILKTHVDVDISVGNSLVDVYARFGSVDDAYHVMEMMAHRDIITYTGLAAGLNQMACHEMALNLFPLMHNDDVKMDDFCLSSFLSAAANLTSMEPGKQLHCYAVKSGLVHNLSVLNSVVDLYGKCGSISDAHKAFMEISEPNVVSWNGLISGLASNGHFSDALSSFEDMHLSGIQPDSVTFLIVLYACSHGGLADLGLDYFNYMRQSYGFLPQFDHYVCLVDLLGRAGRLEEASAVVQTMPFQPDSLIYKTLLASCKTYRNLALGEEMARRALQLDPWDPATYVMLANIYDDAGKMQFGWQIRKMMRERGLRKSPGQSWMEVKNKLYFFCSGDTSNPRTNEIYEHIEFLKRRIGSLGYSYPENARSAHHSEKLALAFGLLTIPSTAPVRIIKNIRICEDCHNFIRLVTCTVDREIIVRDSNRFHSFRKGECSCRGYW